MNSVMKRLMQYGIIPVVVIEEEGDAVWLSDAICEGGLPCVEVTFRTEAGAAAVHMIRKRHPEMTVGAGTVLTVRQAECAAAAGAQFVVSPGFDSEIIDYCVGRYIPVIPGAVTPGEMQYAVKAGLKVVKFFPAELSGGIPMIKAAAEVFSELSFMPTGGLNPENIRGYLGCDKVFACGGSWMVKKEYIKTGNYERIRMLTKEAADIVREMRRENGWQRLLHLEN